MELLTTREFNGVALDCYRADNENDGFWATREQIGQLLEYTNPGISIGNIHNRNKERLDKFSRLIKLIKVEGERDVEREFTMYNFKGFLEICRFSNQPKANAVIDFAWNVMDEIRRTGSYIPDIEAAKTLLNMVYDPIYGLKNSDREKIVARAVQMLGGVQLDKHLYTAKDISKELGISESRVWNKAVNARIVRSGDNIYGFWDDNCEWFFNEVGREKIIEIMKNAARL